MSGWEGRLVWAPHIKCVRERWRRAHRLSWIGGVIMACVQEIERVGFGRTVKGLNVTVTVYLCVC